MCLPKWCQRNFFHWFSLSVTQRLDCDFSAHSETSVGKGCGKAGESWVGKVLRWERNMIEIMVTPKWQSKSKELMTNEQNRRSSKLQLMRFLKEESSPLLHTHSSSLPVCVIVMLLPVFIAVLYQEILIMYHQISYSRLSLKSSDCQCAFVTLILYPKHQKCVWMLHNVQLKAGKGQQDINSYDNP